VSLCVFRAPLQGKQEAKQIKQKQEAKRSKKQEAEARSKKQEARGGAVCTWGVRNEALPYSAFKADTNTKNGNDQGWIIKDHRANHQSQT
jgi:hypothetical protein